MQKNKLLFGCVADDFTGAGDGASFLVKSGISTVLYNGIPKKNLEDKNVQGAVICLLYTSGKYRTRGERCH